MQLEEMSQGLENSMTITHPVEDGRGVVKSKVPSQLQGWRLPQLWKGMVWATGYSPRWGEHWVQWTQTLDKHNV